MDVRVRFAPSPTGYLHIGGARTSIFNWLFARKTKGKFILRIEDTDEVRSTKESLDTILDSLKWLGLDWDEGPIVGGKFGPYFQMQRLHIYQEYVNKLITEEKAYYCYCTPEEIQKTRDEQLFKKQMPKYSGRCRNLTKKQIEEFKNEGRKAVVRFKMPDMGKIKCNDMIRGIVEFDNSMLDDLVIMKASGIPTYNFACVIDDHHMNITHVIRGDDHLSNTPKQIHIYNAFSWELPRFAHLSMILGPDRTKLSKRHCFTSITEYRKNGFVPDAVFNYLLLLGWSTEDSRQIFTKEDAIEKFSIERCAKNPAIFDNKKLVWMNSEYLKKRSGENLYFDFLSWVRLQENYNEDYVNNLKKKKEIVLKLIDIIKEKIKLLSDIPSHIDIFIEDEIKYDSTLIDSLLSGEDVKRILKDIRELYSRIDNFSADIIEQETRKYAELKNINTSSVFHPVRIAVSGRKIGPGLFEMLELLGKEIVLKRLDYTIKNLVK